MRVTGVLFVGPGSLGMGLPGSNTVGVCLPPATQGGIVFMEALWLHLSSAKKGGPGYVPCAHIGPLSVAGSIL